VNRVMLIVFRGHGTSFEVLITKAEGYEGVTRFTSLSGALNASEMTRASRYPGPRGLAREMRVRCHILYSTRLRAGARTPHALEPHRLNVDFSTSP
jgi:hypothetical protein